MMDQQLNVDQRKDTFTGTFANFSTGQVYDQIRQSIAYSGKNVKICASHAGLTLGEDGATHQILEDIGMMKMMPGMTVIVPCDHDQTKAATLALATKDLHTFGLKTQLPIFTTGRPFVIGRPMIDGRTLLYAWAPLERLKEQL
jgi:transketolase